jgi:hypothetical protein
MSKVKDVAAFEPLKKYVGNDFMEYSCKKKKKKRVIPRLECSLVIL